ncbi:hypothetical protein D6C77_02430 [Aureobasidium pullulans]|nr:hypothetical protein D6C77_02430 [Aureobasidium pullulans]
MAQREIPGFYYDAEKGKYFQVQANHIAPQGAKYSHENVRKEKEQSRKRKRSAAMKQKREMQTVRRSRVLDSASAAGIGLWREQGRSHFANYEARIAAMAGQFQGYETLSLKSCESCGKRDNIHDFFIDDELDAILMALGSRNFGRVQFLGESQNAYDIAAFRSDISSVSISSSRTLVATSYDRQHPGNVFVAGMAGSIDMEGSPPILDSPAPCYSMLGGPETALWTASPCPAGATRDVIAIGSSEGVYMLDSRGDLLQHHRLREDVRSIDWLTPTVAVGGTKSSPVYLWDARAAGTSLRFKHTSGVTGVRSLGDGSRVLVSGFKGTSIYDTRMTSRPKGPHTPSPALLRMAPMKTEFPKVSMDVLTDAQLLATADDDNVIQLHSLSSGKLMGSLNGANPSKEKGRIHRMRFVHSPDDRPTLMLTATSVTHHGPTHIRKTYTQQSAITPLHHPIAIDKAIHHNLRLFLARRITNPQTALSTRDSSTHPTATKTKPLHTHTDSATMSDAEDDYMSMSFADPPPPTNPKTSLQRHQERLRIASLKSHPATKKQLEAEAEATREKALATSTLTPTSKGAQMMAKMGFKGGALGKSANARTEPIEINVKEGKGGIGMDNEKKRKIREAMEELQGKEKKQKAEEGEYRIRVAAEREEKKKEGQWWGAMKVCEKLDTEEEEEKTGRKAEVPAKRANLLWRNLAMQREQRDRDRVLRKGALDSLSSRYQDDEADADDKIAMGTEIEEYEDEEDKELDDYNALEIGERLDKVVEYLRKTYHYCFWCKYRYPDDQMEGCPGLTEEEHD